MKIELNSKTIELKSTFRAHIIFEQITGEAFTAKNLTQVVTFLYSTVMASDRDLDLDFEKFLDYLDEHPQTLSEFTAWMVEKEKKTETLNPTKETKRIKQPSKKKKLQS